MKQKNKSNLIAIAILVPVLILAKSIRGLPWWSFVLPVLVTGMIITYLKMEIASFAAGFISGFIVWTGAMLYFNIIYHEVILARLGHGANMLVPLLSGFVGGILTGLALYTGKSIMEDKITRLTL